MSSSNDERSDSELTQKRRKAQRACDSCKLKKRRCDGPQASGGKCSNCVAQGLDCTYQTHQKKRGRRIGFVEILESRIKLLEGLVKKLCPDPSILHGHIYPQDPEYAEKLTKISVQSGPSDAAVSSRVLTSVAEANPDTDVATLLHKLVSLTLGTQEDPFRQPNCVPKCGIFYNKFKSLSLDLREERYWGESSGVSLMREISLLKKDATGTTTQQPTQDTQVKVKPRKKLPLEDFSKPRILDYIYPPPDLMYKLIDLYFEHVNLFYPLLHRPTFDRHIATNLHLRDAGFGGVLLLVCAVGSRYLNRIDERTLREPGDDPFTAGWKWYQQVQVVNPSMSEIQPPTLYDLQIYCLAAEYLLGSCGLQTVWLITGYGLRVAQDVGAHRRIISQDRLTVEDELWKRAFWVLISKDRLMSLALGRPCAIFDNHFDVDLPVECDDQYWENVNPALRFKQQEGVPSTVTAFNRHLQLTKIMSFAMNSVFSVRSNIWELISEGWEYQLVSELDSELNNWLHALPSHLRWDPNRTDDKYLKLSGSLILLYYHVQVLIHRPYIKAEHKPKSLAFPSLAICNSAARSTAVVLDHLSKRFPLVYPFMQLSCSSVMVVLLFNVLGDKRKGIKHQDMKYLRMTIDVFKNAEGMSFCAGPVSETFSDFMAVFNDLERDSNTLGNISSKSGTSNTSQYASSSMPSGHLQHSVVPQASSSAQAAQFSVHDRNLASTYLTPSDGHDVPDTFDFSSRPLTLGDYTRNNHSHYYENVEALIQDPYTSSSTTFNYPQEIQLTVPEFISNPYPNTDASFDNTLPFLMESENAIQPPANNDTMELWSSAPDSFDINLWGSFLSNFMEATDGLVNAGSSANIDQNPSGNGV